MPRTAGLTHRIYIMSTIFPARVNTLNQGPYGILVFSPLWNRAQDWARSLKTSGVWAQGSGCPAANPHFTASICAWNTRASTSLCLSSLICKRKIIKVLYKALWELKAHEVPKRRQQVIAVIVTTGDKDPQEVKTDTSGPNPMWRVGGWGVLNMHTHHLFLCGALLRTSPLHLSRVLIPGELPEASEKKSVF